MGFHVGKYTNPMDCWSLFVFFLGGMVSFFMDSEVFFSLPFWEI